MARPSGRRGRPEAGWIPKRALRSERWAGVGKQAPFLLGQAFRLAIGSPFWPFVPILGPAHELRVVSLGRAFVGKPVREGPQAYEPNISVIALGSMMLVLNYSHDLVT